MSKRARPRNARPTNGGAAAPRDTARPQAAAPRPGFVVLAASSGERVRARLAADVPQFTGGVGGWAEVERPKRATAVTWTGVPARRLQLALLFDGWADNTTVEGALTRLRRMGRPPRASVEPPTVRVRGAVPGRDLRWVIAEIQEGEALYRASDGRRVRQAVTVQLVEAVEPVLVRVSPARRTRDRRGKPARPRTHIVKRGETLRQIAQRELGSAARWREIRDLNRIRDPDRLRPRQVLRLP